VKELEASSFSEKSPLLVAGHRSGTLKVLGISGSPRTKSNTSILVREALKGAETFDAETEFVSLSGKRIEPCSSCKFCFQNEIQGVCKIKDDAGEIIQKMLDADGIIIGSPVYMGGITGSLKCLMDRCLVVNTLEDQEAHRTRIKTGKYTTEDVKDLRLNMKLRNKVGGAIGVGGALSGGQEHAIMAIHSFFLIMDMVIVSDGGIRTSGIHPHFGGVGTSRRKEGIRDDMYAMATSLSVGMRVAEVAARLNARNAKRRI
jgi:multimeric flavodoxin WrbA